MLRPSFGRDSRKVFGFEEFSPIAETERMLASGRYRSHGDPRRVSTILERISAGDKGAVAACVDEYGDLVWRLASRYLDRAKTDIEDAVQEVFVELWQHASRFDPSKGSEPAFVATLAHRRLIDYQRRLKNRPSPGGDAVEATVRALPANLHVEVKRIDAQQAAAEFDRLPDDERRALWMSIYGGMTQMQISEATSTPLGTVKTRMRRGLLRLNSALRGHTDSSGNETGGDA